MTETPVNPNRDRPVCTQEAARAAGLDVAPGPEELRAVSEAIVSLWGDRWAEPDDQVASIADSGAQLARVMPLVLDEVERLRGELSDATAELADNTRAMNALRRHRDTAESRVAELEALKPAQFQDCGVCGAGYEYGQKCSACEFTKQMATATTAPCEEFRQDGECSCPVRHTTP